MRVIAGAARGRRLLSPPAGSGTRPITDRAKEAVFSILAPRLPDCRFLDLFSGTGAVGIEALSRGAAEAVFVERSPAVLRTLSRNLESTGLAAGARVVQGDVFTYLERRPEPFDVVYVAPPQYRGLWQRALEGLDRRPGWLAPGGVAVVQIHPVEYAELELAHLALLDRRDYGQVEVCLYGSTGEP